MAVYKIFPTQDATLYSAYPTMNTGLDAILEASNKLGLDGTPDVARYLVQFNNLEIQDIIANKINNQAISIEEIIFDINKSAKLVNIALMQLEFKGKIIINNGTVIANEL